MRFDIVTIFPGLFAGIFEHGVVKRAIGSRSRPRQWASSSARRVSGGGTSRMAWKSQRNVRQWIRVGP